ncbi:glycosyl transferase [Candidatus Woesebacteria bacterium RIFCSPHIGHO2_01_FULL_38_26b]|uniref:Glycosyl transferase n=1 Tax=Candidatus Woesebacteria bacterium RIFCSPHIGHO2_01_FULL_38_26b TaxID=1802491 RepID=A0A1F7XZV5_9BACT|nr:MAG: glycosyl transferase [Candidatus Woesebacteria bacterium RIFCSPHIGHO2_01_FULL_38_26b]
MKLSIIIPVYNEEKTIEVLVKRVKSAKLPKNLSKEIIVIDDASSDKTASILSLIKGIEVMKHKNNMGKGFAVRTGLKHARGDIILIQDADLEYNPDDYGKLIFPIILGKAKVVYGSRLKNYPLKLFGKKRTPLLTHFLGNKLLTLVTNILYGDGVTDMETCYKVMSRGVLDGIKLNAERFDFEPEITAKILKSGFQIHEIPIRVNPRGYDEGKKISWKDGFIAVWTLIKYKFTD